MSATLTRTGYEAVIGIECHVELKTRTKMFCGCPNQFGAEPNTNVCPVCLGMPGALPVPNRVAIDHMIAAGRAFGCVIPPYSKFDRKNYFYPDMPKDYQISQYDLPICSGGEVTFWLEDGTRKTVRLTRIHIEEDTGKSMHGGSSDGRIAGSAFSLLDFNRAGVPLMECVSEPDIRSAEEAVAYLEALKRTFVALGVSDVKMEEGSLRCDANISIRPVGQVEFGTKTEIKNVNSFRSLFRAVESEIDRQIAVLESGGRVVQETRGWDELAGVSLSMRSKEAAHDYRYFPDPDLPPMEFSDAAPRDISALPQARLQRYIERDGIAPLLAHQVIDTPGLASFFDAACAAGAAPKEALNFILGDLSRLANEHAVRVDASHVTPQAVAELAALVRANTINSKTAKTVIEQLWASGGSPREIVEREGLAQVSDTGAIDAIVDEVLGAQAAIVAEYRAGKTKVLGFLVGQVMKASRGKANPQLAEERLRARLDSAG